MRTLDLTEASKMLYACESTVLELIAHGELPAAKIGRKWVFVDIDLIEYIRSQYAVKQKGEKCHSTNAVKSGGSTSRTKDVELENLLIPATGKRRKPSMTLVK